MRVTVAAPVKATEDADKVEAAATRFFPGEVARAADGVVVHAAGLEAFRLRVWELRIIDTVRGQLLRGAEGPILRFRLAKQAAAAGKVSFPPTPHPLGDLDVKAELEPGDAWADAEALCWWLCPETKDGEIVAKASDN